MSAYHIVNYDIHDFELWSKYAEVVIPMIMNGGGKLLTASSEFTVLEGQPRQVIVVIEFESMAAAKTFYESACYQAIIALRTASTTGWVLISPEFTLPTGSVPLSG